MESTLPCIAVIAAGAMGSAVGKRLSSAGCTVLTNLDGRSEATRRRAYNAGMKDTTLLEIARTANWVLSILPPSDAFSFAERFVEASKSSPGIDQKAISRPLVFADCNAVNPETVGRINSLFFNHPSIKFIDASIIGGPPSGDYDPTIYASVDDENSETLEEFLALSKYGLKISLLKGKGSGIGDASALKMSYAGITKGTTGLFTAMILAAHASSPATAEALLHELHSSQSSLLQRITRTIPPMISKSYRWVGEMEEIASFVGGAEGETYHGLANVYGRIARSARDKEEGGDVDVLDAFVKNAKAETVCGFCIS